MEPHSTKPGLDASGVWSRLRRSAVCMTWLSTGVGLAGSFLLLPLVLGRFTVPEQAVWLFFFLVITLGTLVDFGFTPTTIRATSYFMGGAPAMPRPGHPYTPPKPGTPPNAERLGDLVATGKWIYGVLSVAALLVGGPLGALAARNVIHLAGDKPDHWAALAVLILNVAIAIASSLWSALNQGLGRVNDVRWIEGVTGLVRILASIVVLLAGGKLFALALVNSLGSLANYWWQRRLFREASAEILPTAVLAGARPKVALFREIWPGTWRIGLITLGGYLINQSGGMIVGQIQDAALISRYLLTLRLFGAIRQLATAPVYAVMPNLTRLRARGEIQELKDAFASRLGQVVLLLLILLGIMGVSGNALGRLLLGREVLMNGWMYAVMATGLVLEAHHGAHSNLYVTKNHIPFLIPSLVSGGMILCVGSLLVPEFGLLAVILVQFLVQLAFNNWYPVWLVCQDLGWTIPGYMRACAGGMWRMLTPTRN